MSLTAKIRQKVARVSNRGLSASISKFARDHIYRCERYIMLRLDLSEADRFKRVNLPNYEIIIPNTEAELSTLLESFPHKAHVFRDHFVNGIDIFYGVRDGVAMGYCLATTQPFYDKYMHKFRFRPAEGSFYHFDGFAKPEIRGKLTTLFLMSRLYSHYQAFGYTHALCAVSDTNRASIQFNEKVGFRPTGEVLTSRILFGRRWTRSNQTPPE